MTLTADGRLEDLVRRYGSLIRRVIARVGGAAAANDRDDIEQQIIVNLWRQLEREQPIDHPASYVYRAAVRETLRVVRRQAGREQPAGDAIDFATLVIADGTPETSFEAADRRRTVVEAIDALPPDRRRAVRAHLVGYDVQEIMRMYGWTYQRARNLIARGMADLREALVKKGLRG